jgi:hypothetical protein
MHGPNFGDRKSWTLSTKLPVLSLPAQRGSTAGSPSARSPARNRYLEVTFHSPATSRPSPDNPSRGHSSWPTSSISHRTFTESATVRCTRALPLPPLPFGGSYAPPDQCALFLSICHFSLAVLEVKYRITIS